MLMPDDIQQLLSLMSVIGCYRKFLHDLARSPHSLNRVPNSVLRTQLSPLCWRSWKSYQSFRSWCTLTGTPSPTNLAVFLLYRDARKDGLGATLEQEHGTYPFVPSDSSTEPQSSLKGVGLHSTSHHLEHHARFAVLYEVSCPVSFFRPQALESLDKVADNYLRVQRWLKNSHRVKT